MKLKVQTLDGSGSAKAKGDIDLNDEVFGVEPRAVADGKIRATECPDYVLRPSLRKSWASMMTRYLFPGRSLLHGARS